MYLAAMILGGILGGVVAYNKGRAVFFWTVACGLLPLMLLILSALPRLPQQGVWRPCPFCIPWQAGVCSHCRRDVPPPRSTLCRYCGDAVWAGQERCSRCGNPSPWKEVREKDD